MLSKATDWIIGGLILLVVLSAIFRPYDSTDGEDHRSGLALYVDEATGCHYIKGGMFGTMVPRMMHVRSNGTYTYQHMCNYISTDEAADLIVRGRE